MKKSLRFLGTSASLALAAMALTGCGCWNWGDNCGWDNRCDPCPQRTCRPNCCEQNVNNMCCPQPAWCGDQPRDYCNPNAYRLRY